MEGTLKEFIEWFENIKPFDVVLKTTLSDNVWTVNLSFKAMGSGKTHVLTREEEQYIVKNSKSTQTHVFIPPRSGR